MPEPVAAIPGLAPLPLVGDRLALVRLLRDPVRVLRGLHRAHGRIAALGHRPPLICAFGPTYCQQILPHARDFEHFGEIPLPLPPDSAAARMQANLTVMNGERHAAQRRLLMPAFQRSAIAGYWGDMVAVTERHLARWAAPGDLDLEREMTELTLAVMLRCLFGLDLPEDPDDALRHVGKEMLGRMTSVATILAPVDLPFTPYGRFLRLCARIEARMLELVRARRAGAPGRDALSILVAAHDEAGGRLTDAELVGQMSLLVTAGHETTANALTWTLLLLSQHPRVLADLHDELSGLLRGEAPTVEQLGQLPLLDAVVKESMRLVPPTYMMFLRRARGPFELGPYALPEGAMVVLSPLINHHMAEIWPEPERFAPARWSGRTATPCDFVPFGVGPRMCLGTAFAEQEIRVVLALIVQRFALVPRAGCRVDVAARGITLGPRRGVPVAVSRQARRFGAPAPVAGSIRELVELPS